MSSWEIRFAYRDRSEPLALASQRELPPEERSVAQEIVLEAVTHGLETVGQLLDRLQAASPAQRRRYLDRARQRAGLPATAKVDADRRFEARQRSIAHLPERDADGRALQVCHAKFCTTAPQDPSGASLPVAARRWFCDEHKHLARPGDLEPWELRIRYDGAGAAEFVDDVEVEQAHARREEERLRACRAQRQAERDADAPGVRAHQRAIDEAYKPANLIGRRTP